MLHLVTGPVPYCEAVRVRAHRSTVGLSCPYDRHCQIVAPQHWLLGSPRCLLEMPPGTLKSGLCARQCSWRLYCVSRGCFQSAPWLSGARSVNGQLEGRRHVMRSSRTHRLTETWAHAPHGAWQRKGRMGLGACAQRPCSQCSSWAWVGQMCTHGLGAQPSGHSCP